MISQGGHQSLCTARQFGWGGDLWPAHQLGRAEAVKYLPQELTRTAFKFCELNSHAQGRDAGAHLAESGNLVSVNLQEETEFGAYHFRHGSADVAAAEAQVAQLGPDVLAGFRPPHLHIALAPKTRVLDGRGEPRPADLISPNWFPARSRPIRLPRCRHPPRCECRPVRHARKLGRPSTPRESAPFGCHIAPR